MRAVDTALYDRLMADPLVTSRAPGGVHRFIAPEGTEYPFVVFGQQSGTDVYTQGQRALRDLVYAIEVVDRGMTTETIEQVAQRIDELLTDDPLTIVGWTNLYTRRTADIESIEVQDGIVYQHLGAMFAIEIGAGA